MQIQLRWFFARDDALPIASARPKIPGTAFEGSQHGFERCHPLHWRFARRWLHEGQPATANERTVGEQKVLPTIVGGSQPSLGY